MLNRKITLAASTALLVAITACTTLDPYTREEKTSHAAKGAAIGAAAGVAIGLISGSNSSERKKRALILGGAGALTGGGVGYYMDQQEMKLRQQLEGSGVSVTRMGDNITLNMPGNITFAVDSADISADFYAVLDSVALVLNEFNKTLVEVAGHTDSTGTEQHNQQLSERRADSVAAYLVSRKVTGERLLVLGAGEAYPIASNETVAGRQLNRRVEITIVPLTADS
ncbi:MAG: OmpA family protein [Xanthomonadales bacterium]|nr:OmpA family protein [Gammaproteobacteria bacterium]MBT8072332.1 OmpA family protein [Gammaproteobacteria bacterium]NNK03171.1 OmpA family protein [Xanthomonadales bacterium]NNK98385.1 OmpA family protein [Xanthomonadales bacterium]